MPSGRLSVAPPITPSLSTLNPGTSPPIKRPTGSKKNSLGCPRPYGLLL